MTTVHLELTEEEARELQTALSIRLVGMRDELVHTDDRAYRAGERAEIDLLEGVLRRLEQAMAGATPPARGIAQRSTRR